MIRDGLTGDLFAVPTPAQPVPGSHDYRSQVSGLVGDILKQAADDRYAIASRMSRLAGKDVSKAMLDGYSAESREEFNLPLYLLPALEAACGTHAITHWLVHVRGGRLLIGREALTAELGRLEQLRDEASHAIRDLKKRMEGK